MPNEHVVLYPEDRIYFVSYRSKDNENNFIRSDLCKGLFCFSRVQTFVQTVVVENFIIFLLYLRAKSFWYIFPQIGKNGIYIASWGGSRLRI